jgi:hypothetical protein
MTCVLQMENYDSESDGEYERQMALRQLHRDKLVTRIDCCCNRCITKTRGNRTSDESESDWDSTDSSKKDRDNKDLKYNEGREPDPNGRYGVWFDESVLESLKLQNTTGKRSTPLIKGVQQGKMGLVSMATRDLPGPFQIPGGQLTDDDYREIDRIQSIIVNERGRNGRSPLHYAALSGDAYSTERLLYYNADPEARTARGETPLHVAASHGHVDVMQMLISHNADVHAKDTKSNTPLYAAVLHSKVKDLARRNTGGIEYSQSKQTKQAVHLLLEAGAAADVHAVTLGGVSAYSIVYNRIKLMVRKNTHTSPHNQSTWDLEKELASYAEAYDEKALEKLKTNVRVIEFNQDIRKQVQNIREEKE